MHHISYRTSIVAILSLLLAACASAPGPAPIASGPVPTQIPAQIQQDLLKIGRVIAAPPTASLYTPLQQREPYAAVKVARSERYGSDERHLLDVFTPEAAGGASRPVLVYVHGGGYIAGNRRIGDGPFHDNIMLWAVRNGMVGVNMTYRLAPQNPWPAAQEDIASTLRWVRDNIAARGGDPRRIVLMGHSAGGAHVAQYVGHSQFHIAPGGGLAGAVMISGMFDTSTVEPNPSIQAYFGKDASVYAQRSALPGMVASNVPMLLAYAELDPQSFHTQAEQARDAMCRTSRCPPVLKLMGHSHMSEVYSINTPDVALTDALQAFVAGLR